MRGSTVKRGESYRTIVDLLTRDLTLHDFSNLDVYFYIDESARCWFTSTTLFRVKPTVLTPSRFNPLTFGKKAFFYVSFEFGAFFSWKLQIHLFSLCLSFQFFVLISLKKNWLSVGKQNKELRTEAFIVNHFTSNNSVWEAKCQFLNGLALDRSSDNPC